MGRQNMQTEINIYEQILSKVSSVEDLKKLLQVNVVGVYSNEKNIYYKINILIDIQGNMLSGYACFAIDEIKTGASVSVKLSFVDDIGKLHLEVLEKYFSTVVTLTCLDGDFSQRFAIMQWRKTLIRLLLKTAKVWQLLVLTTSQEQLVTLSKHVETIALQKHLQDQTLALLRVQNLAE